MLSRDVMKAAETVRNADPWDRNRSEFYVRHTDWKSARSLADHILAHREDYDAEGRPLEVDEGFCCKLGMTLEDQHPGEAYWQVWIGGVEVVWFVDGSLRVEAHEIPAERWRLRALLAAMGR